MAEAGGFRMTKRAGDTPRVSSVLDIVKEMNRTMNGDDPAFYAIPDDPDMLAQLLFLYEISGGSGLSQWVNDDYSRMRVQIDISGYDANGLVSDIASIKRLGAELFPDATVSVIGSAANYAAMNRKIVVGQLASFAGAFAIICVLMMLVFGSLLTGLIAMIPNVTPVIIVGGLMGYFGWPLNMLTMTVMPMILGIAVDDTIHFANHVKLLLETESSYGEAIASTFRSVGKSMFMTTAILCACFLMYTFSPLNTLMRIGTLATVGLASALIADYTITPSLLYLAKPLGKKRIAKQR
jgi:predicted RND superfamily exporter protein